MKEFSTYEESIIKQLIEFDTNRVAWNNYVGIPVLDFLSNVLTKMRIYASIKEDKMIFEYSVKNDNVADYQHDLLESQRKIIYILHLISKLSSNSYIACIDLDDKSKNAVIQSLPTYGISDELKKVKIAFDITALDGTFGDCIFKAIIITDDLRVLANANFKTITQRRHEAELTKIQGQLDKADTTITWTRLAFFVALVPAILTCCDQTSRWTTQKETTLLELKNTIEQKKIPDTLKVEVTNDTLVVKQNLKKTNKKTIK